MTLPTLEKRIAEALDCTVEHLEGEHEGKVVVNREVFERHYQSSAVMLRLIRELPEPIFNAADGEHGLGEELGHNAFRAKVIEIITKGCE